MWVSRFLLCTVIRYFVAFYPITSMQNNAGFPFPGCTFISNFVALKPIYTCVQNNVGFPFPGCTFTSKLLLDSLLKYAK